jgi:hypothetical protein
MKRNVPSSPYKQRTTLPRRKCQGSQAAPWQETCLAQAHFHKMETTTNHHYQNVLATGTYVTTHNKKQTSHIYKTILKLIWTSNTALGYGFHFQSKTLRMLVDTPWYVLNTVIRRDLQSPIRRNSSQYSACLSVHPNDLLVNLKEQPDNNRWLPNDLPTKFLVYLSYL